MKQPPGKAYHSIETMSRLKTAALPSHDENLTPPDEVSRRTVLKMFMGASSSLALGLTGCERKPQRKIVSRIKPPEYQKPGKTLSYSSTWTEGPFPYGLVIKTVDGRPIKIDGSPEHPVNQGASTPAMQASLLSLYDPDRLRGPRGRAGDFTWQQADSRIVGALRRASHVVLMTRSTLGPSERSIVQAFLDLAPGSRHFVYEPTEDTSRRTLWRVVYGADGELIPRFDRARRILSLDSDFLGSDGAVLENVRRFSEGRRLENDEAHDHAEMSRLYVIESTMTVTGSNADHRLRLRPSLMRDVAVALLGAIRGDTGALRTCARDHHLDEKRLIALAEDLAQHRGMSLVVGGPHLPEGVHAAVALLNGELQAPGKTLAWNPLPCFPAGQRRHRHGRSASGGPRRTDHARGQPGVRLAGRRL